MWPRKHQAWLQQIQESAIGEGFLGDDECAAYANLLQYPPLNDGSGVPASFDTYAGYYSRRAAERSRAIVCEPLYQQDGFFGSRREFENWLRIRTWREALRLVLEPTKVEAELNQLPAEQRRLLQWVYIDQLNDLEVARVRAAPNSLVGGEAVEAARADCDQAYETLCDLLRLVFPQPDVEDVIPRFLW